MSIGSDLAVSSEESTGGYSLRDWRANHPDITDEHVRGWMLCWLIRHADGHGRCPSLAEFDRIRHGNLRDEFADLAMDVFGGPVEECFRLALQSLWAWVLQTRHGCI